MSAAGGPFQALLAAKSFGMSACQLFTKNNKQWSAPPLSPESIQSFTNTVQETGITCSMSHASYLINLASRNNVLWAKSVAALTDELIRADQLGLKYVVVHPGTASDAEEEFALNRVSTAIDAVLANIPKLKARLLLETTAGQGKSVGHTFQQLGRMLSKARKGRKVDICIDTCHIFAAGYALSPRSDYQETMKEFDGEIGLDRLAMLHVNDSVKGLGSRVDRHAHLGMGAIGLDGLENILSDERFSELPKIMETPKGKSPDGPEWDEINLEKMRKLCNSN